MTKPKIIVEINGGKVIALHSNQDMDFHLVNWDSRGDEPYSWERACKVAFAPDRLVDKSFDYYMNEVLSR